MLLLQTHVDIVFTSTCTRELYTCA